MNGRVKKESEKLAKQPKESKTKQKKADSVAREEQPETMNEPNRDTASV